jgi:hypothetical protein
MHLHCIFAKTFKTFGCLIVLLELIVAVPANSQNLSEQIQPLKEEYGSNFKDFSVPVRIIESPDEAQHTIQLQHDNSERELRNLFAQESVAKSTEKIVWLTILQCILAAIGTIALIYSLLLNRIATQAALHAAQAARDTVNISSETAKRELRAYVSVDPTKIGTVMIDKIIRVPLTIRNCGNTPASDMSVCTAVYVRAVPFVEEKGSLPQEGAPAIAICAGQSFEIVAYTDVFGDRHLTEFNYNFGGVQNFENQRLAISPFGNRQT